MVSIARFRPALFLLALALLLAAPPAGRAQDPVIAKLLDRVSLARLDADVAALAAAGGNPDRRSDSTGGVSGSGGLWAQDFLYARFQSLGYADLYLHDFDPNTDNVVATFPGLLAPDEIHVIGAHYDSVNGGGSGSLFPAPGADDNASGTAGVLEIARVLAESGVRFEATIRLVAFASEEFGTLGSAAFVDDAVAAGDDVRDAVVMDVLGWNDPATPWNVAVAVADLPTLPPGQFELQDLAVSVVESYLPGTQWEAGRDCG